MTFCGKPIVIGRIRFEPDAAAGNSGPQGAANIREGAFDTADGGTHPVMGPHVARIDGYDGVRDLPLVMNYETKVDLDGSDAGLVIDVPESGRFNYKP